MARLWSCGFELQSATSGIEWNTTTGSPTINTSIKRSGAASLRVNPTAATAFIRHKVMATGAGTLFFRGYIYIASAPAGGTTIMSILASTSAGGSMVLLNDRTLILINGAGTQIGSASAAIPLNEWHYIELSFIASAGTHTVTGKLDGTQFASGAGSAVTLIDSVWIGCIDTDTADLYFDDLAVNDTTGSAQTGFPGPGSIVHMKPDGAGDNAQWASGAGGTNNWDRVDEITPDDATTYNKRINTGTLIDDHALESSANAGIDSGATITLVQVGVRIGAISATSTARDGVLRIKSQASGTLLESAAIDWSVNGWATHMDTTGIQVYKLTSYTDPQGGGAWTPALLDTAQIGYKNNTSSTNEIRVSTAWALVEFIPSAHVTKTFTVDGIVKTVNTPTFTVDGIVKVVNTGSFTIDGIVKAATLKTFTVDGIVLAHQSTSFTVDGIVKETKTTTFTVDGIVKVVSTQTFTVDGIVLAHQSTSFTVDGIVRTTVTNTFTVDGIVKTVNTATYTIDGIVKEAKTTTFTVDGIVKETKTATFTVDGIVKSIVTTTFTVDGIIKTVNAQTFTVDGLIVGSNTTTFTVDGIVKEVKTITFTVDGIVRLINIQTFTVDGIVKATNTTSFTVDGIIKKVYYQHFGQSNIPDNWTEYGNGTWIYNGENAENTVVGAGDPNKVLYQGDEFTQDRIAQVSLTIKALGTNDDRIGLSLLSKADDIGKGLNVVIRGNTGQQQLMFLDDGLAWSAASQVLTIAVGEVWWIKGKYESGTIYGKAWKEGTAEPDWQISWVRSVGANYKYSGIVGNSVSLTSRASFDNFYVYTLGTDITHFTADGIVKAQTTNTFTVDGIVKEINTKTFTVDGIVLAHQTQTFTIDGIVRETKTVTFTVDGIIKLVSTSTFTVDGIVKEINTKTFTVDGIVRAATLETFTVDGVIIAAGIVVFSVDGIVLTHVTNTFTVDGLIVNPIAKTFTIDGIITDGKYYTREDKTSLPTDATDLATIYTSSDYTDVGSSNDVRVEQTGELTEYILHLFKKLNINNTDGIRISVELQAAHAPTVYPVLLQIYNYNAAAWETLDTNNSAAADTDFVLTGRITSGNSNYYTGGDWIACRVYQSLN